MSSAVLNRIKKWKNKFYKNFELASQKHRATFYFNTYFS